jgi:hypothetical protein
MLFIYNAHTSLLCAQKYFIAGSVQVAAGCECGRACQLWLRTQHVTREKDSICFAVIGAYILYPSFSPPKPPIPIALWQNAQQHFLPVGLMEQRISPLCSLKITKKKSISCEIFIF